MRSRTIAGALAAGVGALAVAAGIGTAAASGPAADHWLQNSRLGSVAGPAALNDLGPGKIRGLSADPSESLAAVGLSERAGQRVSRLSAGEQVRVAIACALAVRPSMLLVDEPTARLDQANALRLATLLTTLARESGAAVVCATHDPVVIEQADGRLSLAAEPVAVG